MHPTKEKLEKNPIVDLIKNAERVQIRELSAKKGQVLQSSVHHIFKEFDRAREDQPQRIFFLALTPKEEVQEKLASFNDSDRDYLLRCADLLLSQKDFVLARNIYSFILKQNLKDPKALKGFGICLFHLGKSPAAKKCFNALWKVHKNQDALFWLGKCFVVEKNDVKALECFKDLQIDKKLPTKERAFLYKETGHASARVGNEHDAILYYRKALEVDPGDTSIHVNLGILEFQRQRLIDARDQFNKALTVDTNCASAHCGLGLLAVSEKNYPLAKKEFMTCLTQDSSNDIALTQLIVIAHETKKYSSIKRKLQELLEKEQDNQQLHCALADIYMKEDNWDLCEREIDKVLQLQPTHEKAKTLKEELTRKRYLFT